MNSSTGFTGFSDIFSIRLLKKISMLGCESCGGCEIPR